MSESQTSKAFGALEVAASPAILLSSVEVLTSDMPFIAKIVGGTALLIANTYAIVDGSNRLTR